MKRDDYKETLGNEGKEKVIGEAVLYDSLWDVSEKVDSIDMYEKSIGGAISIEEHFRRIGQKCWRESHSQVVFQLHNQDYLL